MQVVVADVEKNTCGTWVFKTQVPPFSFPTPLLLLLPLFFSSNPWFFFVGSAFSREAFGSCNSSSSLVLLHRLLLLLLLLLLPSNLVLQFFRSVYTSIELEFEKLELHVDNIAPTQHQNSSLWSLSLFTTNSSFTDSRC